MRHTGSGSLPVVGDFVKSMNNSVFNGVLENGTTYSWFIITAYLTYPNSPNQFEKFLIKLDSAGEVLDKISCNRLTTALLCLSDPSVPTTTLTYSMQSCPAAWSYTNGQSFPTLLRVDLGYGVGWVNMAICG